MTVEKIAIITAGGSGMGAAAARRLAADGFKVAVLSSSGKGEALAQELGGFGVTGSNQSNDDLKRLVDGTLERWGRIDVLVNSAGHGPPATSRPHGVPVPGRDPRRLSARGGRTPPTGPDTPCGVSDLPVRPPTTHLSRARRAHVEGEHA